MNDCPHKELKKQIVGEGSWYVCIACSQKFKAESWDGKVTVVAKEPQQLQCTQCGMVGYFPKNLSVGADGKFSLSESDVEELEELSKRTKFIQGPVAPRKRSE